MTRTKADFHQKRNFASRWPSVLPPFFLILTSALPTCWPSQNFQLCQPLSLSVCVCVWEGRSSLGYLFIVNNLVSVLLRVLQRKRTNRIYTDIYREIYYEGLALRVTEAEKSLNLLPASWRSRRLGGSSPNTNTLTRGAKV